MDTYTFLREVAGSWMLVFMFIFFVGVVIWVLTGRKSSYRDSAEIIFRHDDGPVVDTPDSPEHRKKKEAR